MSFQRVILKPVAFLGGLHASRQVRAFLGAHRQTQAVQESLLRDLVARHRDTVFGREHGFEHIRTYEDFAAAVPVRNYDGLRPWMNRVYQGDITALLPADEEVLMFSQTSGTTGEPKYIPVTRQFLASLKRGWNIWGLMALRDHPKAWLRHILQISSSMHESQSPSGKPCGAISGLLAATQKKIVRRMYVSPACVAEIRDVNSKYYTTLRCGLMRDVAFISTANPSSTIKLIETGQAHADQLVRDVRDGTLTPPGDVPAAVRNLRFAPQPTMARRLEQGISRDGALLPRHFWNLSFLSNWTGGTIQLYLPRLRELFGDVQVRDIGLLASEGRFSVPIADHTPAGLAEITGNFLEFMPVEEAGSANPRVVRAHEAQVGQEYFLVVTNWAGLWRYNIDDRVRVVDRLGESPIFEFLSRGLHTANITGEKITEHQVVESMRRACAACGLSVQRFVLQGRFAQMPYYELRLETGDDATAGKLSQAMDKALAELNIEYHSKRSGGRLGPIEAKRLEPGTLAQAESAKIAARRGRSEQYKHQYLLTDVIQ